MNATDNDVVIRYLVQLVDDGTKKLLENDRTVRKNVAQTGTAMTGMAAKAVEAGRRQTQASSTVAAGLEKLSSTSSSVAQRVRENAGTQVTAFAKVEEATRKLERNGSKSLKETDRHVGNLSGSLRKLARAGAGLGGMWVAWEKGKDAVKTTMELAEETEKLSGATGMDSRTASAWIAVANGRQISAQKLSTSFTLLSRNVDRVTQGAAKNKAAVAGLGPIMGTLTVSQQKLAKEAMNAAAGSTRQVKALAALKKSLADQATAEKVVHASRTTATLSAAQQYTMTKSQIAAWKESQKEQAASARVQGVTDSSRLQSQQKAVAAALSGASSTEKLRTSFTRLGITQKDLEEGQTDFQGLLLKVADGLKKAGHGTESMALAQQLLGRGGRNLAAVLREGSDGTQEQIDLATKYGATLDGHTIKSMKQLLQAQREMTYANTGLQIAFTEKVEPVLVDLAGHASKVAQAFSQPGLDINKRMQLATDQLDQLDIGGKVATAIRVGLPVMAAEAAKSAPVILHAFWDGLKDAGPGGDTVIALAILKKTGLLGAGAKGLFHAAGKGLGISAMGGVKEGKGSGGATGLIESAAARGSSRENPLWVRMATDEHGKKTPPGGGGAAAKAAAETGEDAAKLDATKSLGKAGLITLGIGGFANAGKPGTVGHPLNLLNAFAQGADPTSVLNAIGVRSVSQRVLPKVKRVGFDPNADPADVMRYALTGVDPTLAKVAIPRNPLVTGTSKDATDAQKALAALSNQLAKLSPNDSKGLTALADQAHAVAAQLPQSGKELDGFIARVDALAAPFDQVSAVAGKSMSTIESAVARSTRQIEQHLGSDTAAGKDALAHNFDLAVAAIQKSMAAGEVSTKKGLAAIRSMVAQELQVYGVSAKDSAHVASQTSDSATGFYLAGHAAGGFIGQPGERGRDTVMALLGRGEAVANGSQQKVINTALATAHAMGTVPYGSLGSLFSNVTTPHSQTRFAQGGFVAEPGTNFLVGSEPTIVRDLRRLGEMLNTTIYGISGYRSPGHSVAVGGFADDPHTRGAAADIGVGSPTLASASVLTAAELARVGLYRPFYPASAHEINHVQLLSGDATGGARGTTKAKAAAAHAARVRRVKTSMTGDLGVIVQGGLDKARKAANARLRKAAGTGGSDLSGFTGGGNAAANERLGRRMMLAMGFDDGEWPSLRSLWTGESGWNSKARNASSGAFGIPQALPPGKMGAKAAGGDPAAQIDWGLHYIKSRYGTPSEAYKEWLARSPHWYERGGMVGWGGAQAHGGDYMVNKPTLFLAGEKGAERATFTPQRFAQGGIASATNTLYHGATGSSATDAVKRIEDVAGSATVAVINTAEIRVESLLDQLAAKGQVDGPAVAGLKRATDALDQAMFTRASGWVKKLGSLSDSGRDQAKAQDILGALPTALGGMNWEQLEQVRAQATAKAGGANVTDRAAAIQKQIDAARKSGASHKTLDDLAAELKAAKAGDKSSSAQRTNLKDVLSKVKDAEGQYIDGVADRIQKTIDALGTARDNMERGLRNKGISLDSSIGDQAAVGQDTSDIATLRGSRAGLKQQIARATALGDRGRVATLTDQLATVKSSLAEAKTVRREDVRKTRTQAAQESVDYAGFQAGMGDSSLTALDIAQQAAQSADTATGMRAKAAAEIANLPKKQQEVAAAQEQVAAAVKNHDIPGWTAAMKAAADAANDLAQSQADAADLIRQAAQQQSQTLIDSATANESLLEAQQRLAGTDNTPAGMVARAAGLTAEESGKQGQVDYFNDQAAAAAAAGDMDTFTKMTTNATNALADLTSTEADAADLMKQAAEAAAQSTVDLATHAATMTDLGLTHLELVQKLAGTYDTGGQARADYIKAQEIPAVQAVIDALVQQQAVAAAQGDQVLADQIAESIAGKQNDLLQEQVDAAEEIAANTKPRAFGGGLAFSYGGETLTDALVSASNGI